MYLVDRGSCKSFAYTPEDLKFFRLPHAQATDGDADQQEHENTRQLLDSVLNQFRALDGNAAEAESKEEAKDGQRRAPGNHHEHVGHHYEQHPDASATTTTTGIEKHHLADWVDPALHHQSHRSEAEWNPDESPTSAKRHAPLPNATPYVVSTEAGPGGLSSHSVKCDLVAPPLLYSARARSMLHLTGLTANSFARMQRRGAMTLDSENWVDIVLSTDSAGQLFSEPYHHSPGPLSVQGEAGLPRRNADRKNTLGMLREVWRVEEIWLAHIGHILRIEFVHGNSVSLNFREEALRRAWVQHLKRFRNAEDHVIRAFIAQRTADSTFVKGEMFGSDEMQNPNQFEAQSGTRRCSILCEQNSRLLVIPRMDFLTVVARSSVFGLQDRIASLKLSGLIDLGDHARLFQTARALMPITSRANEVICRAGMKADAIHIVFRGFVSVCDDNLEINVDQDSKSFAERGTTYVSNAHRIETLGHGEAFGHAEALEGYPTFRHTLVADCNAVLWRLPLAAFLERSTTTEDMKSGQDARPPPRRQDVDPRQVPKKVGSAANILEQILKNSQKAAPPLSELLNSHAIRVPAAPVSKRGRKDPKSVRQDVQISESMTSTSSPQLDVATRTEIHAYDDPSLDAVGLSPTLQDDINNDKIDLIRRQFRVPPHFAKPRLLFAPRTPKNTPSVPKLDLTRFIRRAHVDDQDDDEVGFEEFGVDESCRDVIRSLRKVAQYRAPSQRTTSQYIKDLVLNAKDSVSREPHADAGAANVAAGLILRMDGVANGPGKSSFVHDSIRYTFRDLAIAPGGIIVYPNSRAKVSTVFVKFDHIEDLHSGLSQALRLGMHAQESTVNELATFHVLYKVQFAAKSQATPMSTAPHTARGSFQGSRLNTASGMRTPRSAPSTVRLSSPCRALMPNLTAIGSSRPWTAPTAPGSPLQLSGTWRRGQGPRPGSMHTSKRATLQEQPRGVRMPL